MMFKQNLEKSGINILLLHESIDFLLTTRSYLGNKSNGRYKIDTFNDLHIDLILKSKKIDILVTKYYLELNDQLKGRIDQNNPSYIILFSDMGFEELDKEMIHSESIYYVKKEKNLEIFLLELYFTIEKIVLTIEYKNEIRASNEKFHSLFEEVPILLWEQDWSKLKLKFDEFRKDGIETGYELREFFNKHFDNLDYFISLIENINVNKAAMEFNGIKNKADMLGPIKQLLTSNSKDLFINEAVNYFEGKKSFSMVLETTNLSGKKIFTHFRSFVPSSHEKNLSRTIVLLIDVTEKIESEISQVKKEKQLLKSESKRLAILNAIPDPIYELDKNGKYLSFHGEAQETYNLSERFEGKKIDDVLPADVALLFHKTIEKTLNSSEKQSFDYSLLYESQKRYYNAQMVNLDDSAVLVISREVTALKKAELILRENAINEQKSVQEQLSKTLRTETEKFQVLVQNAPNGIMLSDVNGFITFVNRNINIYTKNEVIGLHVTQLVDSQYKEMVENKLKHILETGESISIELQAFKTRTWVQVNIGPLKRDGQVESLFYIITNTSAIKKVNSELKEFAYVVSHDLKAPLESLSSMVNYLFSEQSKISKEEINESLSMINMRVSLMQDLIDGILDYSNIGLIEESKEIVDTVKLVNDLLKTIKLPKPFDLYVDESLPNFRFNRIRIYQLFQNLISNSLKYNDKKKGYLSIQGNLRNSDNYEIMITDNGIGISQDYQEKVFQLFETGNNNGSIKGTGIGLAIVKKIIDLLGGKIRIESELGERTVFQLIIPVKYLVFKTNE